MKKYGGGIFDFDPILLSFDVEKEEFWSINCPIPKLNGWKLSLTSWKQSLVCVFFSTAKKRIEVWALKDHKSNNWIREFCSKEVDLVKWCKNKGLFPRKAPGRLLGEWNDGFLFEIYEGKNYMLYNPNEDNIEFLDVLPTLEYGELMLFTPNFTRLRNGPMATKEGIIHLEGLASKKDKLLELIL
ncbi:hypothetical protein ACFE04_020285 [Oxalis oulophora]